VAVAVAVAVAVTVAVAVGVNVGVAVGVGVLWISGTKLTKTSGCEVPLMITRPSVQPPMAVFPLALW